MRADQSLLPLCPALGPEADSCGDITGCRLPLWIHQAAVGSQGADEGQLDLSEPSPNAGEPQLPSADPPTLFPAELKISWLPPGLCGAVALNNNFSLILIFY